MPITFPATKLTVVAEIALGVDPASDPTGWSWTNITAYVRYDPAISTTRGRGDEDSQVQAASAHLTLDNRDGRFCRRNPRGAYYGQLSRNTPIRIGVNPGDGVHYRFHGFVNEWPTRWDVTGRDSNVPVTCAGIMRRLTRQRALRSALTRAMDGISAGDFVPVAHWPMEEPSGATSFGNLRGGGPATISGTGASLSTYSGASGSAPAPTLSDAVTIAGVFPPFTLVPRAGGDVIWQTHFIGMIPSGMSADAVFLDVFVPPNGGDNIAKLRIHWVNASSLLQLRFYDRSGTNIGNAAIDFAAHPLFDMPVLYGMSIYTQSGSPGAVSAQFAAYLPGYPGTVAFGVSSWLGSIPLPQSWRAYGNAINAGWSFSHYALYSDPAIFALPNQQDNANAINGFSGEMAHDRMIRVSREENASFTTTATASAAMGPQPVDNLLGVLRDCEAADQGLLYELEFGLGYKAANQRYNQTSGLDLDFDAHDIADPPEPADDDQRTVNRYTASRTGGSWATAEDSDSIATDGLYESSGTFNVETDEQIVQVAEWRLHLGLVDEDRWPAVPIRLTRTPARITNWVALGVGDRITIANPPDQVAPDTISAIAEGWDEAFNPHDWAAVLNTSPATAYEAFKVEDQTRGRLDTAGCILNSAATSGATTLKLCTYSGPLWITSAARAGDFPFSGAAAGEKVTVTAMAAVTAPTFVAAGTASSGSSGSRTPGAPAAIAADDTVLIFASSRSLTATVDTPANWTKLADFGNAALLARVYDGLWSMPTVTFTGDTASEDTIAQSAALRSMCADLSKIVVNSSFQANAAAQDVATPYLAVRQDRCVVLYLGWKRDDYTSVAAISGATEIQEASSVAGNDASQIWDYLIQTTQTDVPPNTFTVTGGAAAVSIGAVVALVGGTQSATVTRAVNGVAKAQVQGEPFGLYRPAVIAL